MSSQPSLFVTSDELGEQFKAELLNGAEGHCPACGRFCKVYHRRIHSNMARQLIALYHLSKISRQEAGSDYVHTRQVRAMCSYSDFTLAKHWGLVEAKLNHDEPTKKETGLWKLTPAGVQFVEGATLIPKYAYLFDDRCIGFSEEMVGIHASLGRKFNYQELFEYRTTTKEKGNAA